jgi:Fe-S-cluster containining protein
MNKKLPRRILREFQEEINKSICDFADCSICAICCMEEKLTLHTPDINRISRKLGMKREAFLDKYTYYHKEWNEIQMNMPCPFLDNNRCKIYSIRPEMCRNYPVFVNEDEFIDIKEIEYCALATHFYEAYLEFLSKYYPDCYQKHMKVNPTKLPSGNLTEEEKIKNAYFSIGHVAKFIEWLNLPEDADE